MKWYTILSALIGGLGAWICNIIYNGKQRKKELRSLILAFVSELVLAFDRCSEYYKQSYEGKISYSGLFDFTDASIFSRFSTVNPDPEVAEIIVELKSNYFHIKGHAEEAAKLISQASRLARNSPESKKYKEAAMHAQGVAIAFFLTDYENIVRRTAILLDAAKTICSGRSRKIVESYEKKFEEAKQKKERTRSSGVLSE